MNALERFRTLVQSAPVLGDVVLVGNFLNHRVDVPALTEAGRVLAGRLPRADLVLTAEAGGIAPAYAVAQALELPLVFARRSRERLPGEVLQVEAGRHHLAVSREAVPPGAEVLLVDDILGHGRTPLALAQLAAAGGARAVAYAAFVEKTFQGGRGRLEVAGVPVFSLVQLAWRGGEVIPERRSVEPPGNG